VDHTLVQGKVSWSAKWGCFHWPVTLSISACTFSGRRGSITFTLLWVFF
jgi:hypothetical protein